MKSDPFQHLIAAQVALAKAHMAFLDSDHLDEPDWETIDDRLSTALAELAKVKSA